MTYRAADYLAFWDGISAIVRACGGSDTCTNVARQNAVVDVERALGNICKADREPLVQEVIAAWADYYDGDFGPPHGKEELLGALKALAEWKP